MKKQEIKDFLDNLEERGVIRIDEQSDAFYLYSQEKQAFVHAGYVKNPRNKKLYSNEIMEIINQFI